MTFVSSKFLFLLLSLPIIIFLYIQTRKNHSYSVKHPRVSMSKVLKSRYYIKDVPFALIVSALFFSIIGLARPAKVSHLSDINGEGIYISLVVDVSPSMMAEDMMPTRLEASKKTMIDFIKKRNFDKISLVAFALKTSVLSPATFDYISLEEEIKKIKIDEEGSTSIGLGIATAVDMLRNIKDNNEKIIILLTDGENNSGEIDPKLASEIASNFNIKIYTIGIGDANGSNAWVTYNDPNYGKRRVRADFTLNEEALIDIAASTGGKYFNAKTTSALDNVYNTIDRIEKKPILDDNLIKYEELYKPFIITALICICLSIILSTTRFLIIP
ncbi:VWA domain-containing protein [uncultured Brachyspira sp.]|uniref:VWA domain-containing protein n=1 Tax=uncultured Brachyspira sp. TaxID=221953 RepID=UPI0034329D15